ncbi:integrase catalytic domain-containing protein [Trichonephila clavipes]|nr:integrase catalytic domain-containing protein [Trichonephila clavipes]
MFKNCRKEDLRIVALELELIQYTIEDRKRIKEDRKKEAENRLREKELELELARLNVNSDNERTGEGCNTLDALVKSVRILTVKVPNRPEDAKGKEHCGFIQAADNLEHSIKKFWEIENVEIDSVKTSELDICEDHFKSTHSRDDQGRYTVAMPLKEDPSCLGESRQTAIQRLNSLWKRLSRDKEYLSLYEKFLQEYEDLGHMREIKADGSGVSFYMPHHGVYRPEKSTTKMRTVFNASSPSTSGKSLNSIQFNGGLVQEDLFSIMVRFRKHKYAFITDIEKMFRMINIHPEQTCLQRILWKKGIGEPIKTYELTTVTYGTVSAPYLATRTLKQLAMDEANNFPLAAPVLLSDCCMDDILSGSESIEEVIELQHQLIEMFKTAGMQLHKWCGNLPEITSNLQEYAFLESEETKALGMIWNPKLDCFLFRIEQQRPTSFTKRMVLSTIARIFDPLGLLGPIITWAKIFMQRLWLLELGWSDELPFKEQKEWRRFIDSLKAVNNISIDRCIVIHRAESIELHAFSDASEKAYGSSIYLKSISALGEVKVCLVTSKSRVSPLKQISIPRLELCGAVLAAKLMKKVKEALNLQITAVHFLVGFDYCDFMDTSRIKRIEDIQGEKEVPLTTSEVNDAETWLIKQDQSGINLSDPSGNLKSLNIFQDDKGILRVGGRLEKASIPYSQKHPAILAKNSKLSKIYFITLHKKLFHVGPQGLLNAVRLRFWALGGRNLARKTVHTCVVCFKCKPIPSSQIMGNLPYERVNMAPPFSITGLDLGDQNLAAYFTEEGIEWNFIPPRAPHMGGLWEAGIKSVKYHLKRALGRSRLTYEEFETVIIQRGKWMMEKDNVMCGTMVIVKEDFTPVCNWLLGRVVEVNHGSDGKCGVMDLPTPSQRLNEKESGLDTAIKTVATVSMQIVAKKAKDVSGHSDIPVAIDGTWQKRGHTSLNGAVTATSVDAGKVLDASILSRFFSGAIEIFQHSESLHGLRYSKFFGDGDSRVYKAVNEMQPYGDTGIEKLECVGHVEKWMGTRLRALKLKIKGKKSSDEKTLGSRSRLTEVEINKLQRYYGLAIRNNTDSINSMKKAIWATYFHKASTDAYPQHSLCPTNEDPWCGYNRAIIYNR